MTSNRADPNEVESNAQAFVHRVASSGTRPVSEGWEGEAKEAFFHMMSEWCGSLEHYIRDCLEKSEKEKVQTIRLSSTVARGRPPRNPGNISSNHGVTKDSAVRSEARAPTKAYAIHERKKASVLDVITGTFSIFDIDVTVLIDPRSTHLYVCTNLVSNKNLPIKSTEFVVNVLNPLHQYVFVDKVCKNCPLIQGYSFPDDLILLPFGKFDVILSMDWLNLDDVTMNCE
ncbi:uncharacterized protein LOC108451264 [Gossypium arboreum]|uniref:uncharacterized protein LOC108451264 n=1 Tax=Gossypium arboreum TaxID=29729 RepID=UPI000818F6C1|nr:uncharacterized protein LOC108451264 [Gossypium arboreum]